MVSSVIENYIGGLSMFLENENRNIIKIKRLTLGIKNVIAISHFYLYANTLILMNNLLRINSIFLVESLNSCISVINPSSDLSVIDTI